MRARLLIAPAALLMMALPAAPAVAGLGQPADATGASGVAAAVEPDVDGDGWGDTTQDACPNDFTTHTAPCPGTTTFGSPLTRLRVRAMPAAGDTVVQVLRPAAGGAFTVVAESAAIDATTDAVVAVPAQVVVQPGDVLAARSVGGGLGAVAVVVGDQLATAAPHRPGDAAFPMTGTTPDRRLLVQADVEPDADGDGKGDITQEPPAPPPAPPAFVPPPQQPLVAPACGHVVRGTRDDDVVRGTVFGDRLVGGDGDDLLKGATGDDCLEGGAGSDVLDGGSGDDRLSGASGNDRLIGGSGNDKLTGSRGKDRLSGGQGDDTLSPGDGKDTILAGGGNDTINASDGTRETVDCGSGRDTVRADRRDHLIHCEKVTRRR
jgi:RTX calcium-binding nonapeptide repeat (4 copies)